MKSIKYIINRTLYSCDGNTACDSICKCILKIKRYIPYRMTFMEGRSYFTQHPGLFPHFGVRRKVLIKEETQKP